MKADVLKQVATNLIDGKVDVAAQIVQKEYPFVYVERAKRTYTESQKMKQFIKDGFIDRYSGDKLVNPGILKVITCYLPKDFPYHPHGKMDECHNAYWELIPSVDHINPIARGGLNNEDNYVTTSMLHNLIKNNWTLEQLQWKLYPAGDIDKWDGLTRLFIELVEANRELLKDAYIKRWYALSIASYE